MFIRFLLWLLCLRCRRRFTTNYYYIGGYYGASTMGAMQQEIFENGPIAVSFEVRSCPSVCRLPSGSRSGLTHAGRWLRGESRCTRISTTTRAASTTTPTWYVPHAPGSAAPPDVCICAYVRASDGRCRRIRLNVHVGDVQSVRTDQPRGADRGLGHRERCGLLDREEQLGLDLG